MHPGFALWLKSGVYSVREVKTVSDADGCGQGCYRAGERQGVGYLRAVGCGGRWLSLRRSSALLRIRPWRCRIASRRAGSKACDVGMGLAVNERDQPIVRHVGLAEAFVCAAAGTGHTRENWVVTG